MYHVAVYFDIKPGHRDDFIAAALTDGRDSGANEPGTQRFELIQDESNPDRFYLNEGYADLEAFSAHAAGPYFEKFFADIKPYAESPTWLIRGTRIQDPVAATAVQQPSNTAGIRYADHVALRVADYDASLAFYTDTLGFELEKEWTLGDAVPDVRFAYVRLGEFQIELVGDGGPTATFDAADIGGHLGHGGYAHLCLRVSDLEATVRTLRERGVTIFAEPFVVEPIGQRLAMIKDNSGNVIELAQSLSA